MLSRLCRVAVLCLIGLAGPAVAQGDTLWEIGKADGTGAEFALAPAGLEQFRDDGFYVVGLSDPARDWPYAQPGPADRWGQTREHTYIILFDLERIPAAGECALYVNLADTHATRSPALDVQVNDNSFKRPTKRGGGDASIHGDLSAAQPQEVKFTFPASLLKMGENRIAITSKLGSWMIYDAIRLETPAGAALSHAPGSPVRLGETDSPPVLLRDGAGTVQPLRMTLRYTGDPAEVTVQADGGPARTVTLVPGLQTVEAVVPPVREAAAVTLTLRKGDTVLGQVNAAAKPVRPWKVFLLHHTHLDIGYTHHQSEVERLQWQHLDLALDLIAKTADYPPEARFSWLPEGLWAVDSYLKQASPEKRAAFKQAVRNGDIGLDALYGNQLTALCRPEELLELTGCARRLAAEIGTPLESAMISDVPGYTWGTVTALSQSGVKFFSIGPNRGHRIGYTLSEWGDKPFYWVSPSGKERVLCWIHGQGYSWFHTGLNYKEIERTANEAQIFGYLEELDEAKFPYNTIIIRYNIGSDNGPPDPGLPDFVKQWNERYAYPRMAIATAAEAFKDFEAQYGAVIPEVRGDFTPYWEDGAASSAAETIQNRAAAERLVQAQAVWALLGTPAYPAAAFQAAWREAILYDEHTWGAYNSISDPECDFALQQWATKQSFAVNAEKQSRDLLEQAAAPARAASGEIAAVLVLNTNNWPRTDLVTLPADWQLKGGRVVDAAGNAVPSQRLTTGELAFLASDLPPLSSAVYRIEPGEPAAEGKAFADGRRLTNGVVSIALDANTGTIHSLTREGVPGDLSDGRELNQYLYVTGRKPEAPQPSGTPMIHEKEIGPLVASLLLTSDAPGCRGLTRELRMITGLDRVEIIDTLDKEKVFEQEAVHIAFPFNVPDGRVRMDLPFAVVEPDSGQLPGSCKNYFTVQRFVDVANDTLGVTWATPDAPLIEIGAITCDPTSVGWLTETKQPLSTIYAYVMNNYWETNYKAEQHGPTTFRFMLRPHGAYDAAAAHRFGVECSQPLVAVPAGADAAPKSLLAGWAFGDAVVQCVKPADDGQGLVVRLYNPTDQPQAVSFPAEAAVIKSDLNETRGEPVTGALALVPWDLMTVRTEVGAS